MVKKVALISVMVLMVFFPVFGQKALQYHLQKPKNIVYFQKQDKQRLLAEDMAQTGKGRMRCAVLLPANIDFPGAIQPEIVKEGKIWRLQIDADEAEAINLYLEDFYLSKGSELSFYSPDYEYKLQTVSSDENTADKIYVTDHLAGSSFVIELFTPTGVADNSFFIIKELGYMYRPLPQWLNNSKNFGASGSCEVNVNCPEGKDWQEEKLGVARIISIAGGVSYYCSGSLINNARNDRTPYFLTADHCGEDATETDFKRWKFYFNFESSTCENPINTPHASYTATGSEVIARGDFGGGSDFLLLKLEDVVSSIPNLFFNGWDISTTPATNGVGIHHPAGDIKKISTYDAPLQNDGDTHWKVNWVQTETNWGVTEGGSSGSPIFNQNRLIVGTLTGGYSDCATQSEADYYGKMSYHWDKNGLLPTNRLQPWLDPDDTGITNLDGIATPPVGISEPSKERFDVWPNPVYDFVNIETKSFDNQEIRILDIMGNILIEKQFSGNDGIYKLNLSHLPSGVYIMVAVNENSCKTQKIIKI